MATYDWIGNAHAVRQISTITVANTWATNDTATITINDKDLVVTIGATVTTANVATAIQEAWMAGSRLDGTTTSGCTSNFGGQEFGEFREMRATVSGSVVTLIGNTPGKPVTISVTESTAGSGTATGATATTATGPNHWDNGDNWRKQSDGTTGTVPANDDTAVFRNCSVKCLHGLPNNSKEVTIEQWQSYTGEVGLPPVNLDDPSYPYSEYRQRYVRLDDAGTGTNIAHRFGLGTDGSGCTLFNLHHKTLQTSPIVYATGTPRTDRPGSKALNICCEANTSTINILGGSVDCGSQDYGTSAFVTFTQSGGDVRCINGLKLDANVYVNAGTCVMGGTLDIDLIASYGGVLRLENHTGQIGSILHVLGGTVQVASAIQIADINAAKGKLDFSDSAGTVTVSACSLYPECEFIDPYARVTAANNFFIYGEPTSKWQFGANPSNGAKVVL